MAWVISVVAIAFFIPVCAWVRLGTATLAFFSRTTPVIHFSSISRRPPSLSTFKQLGVKKCVANVLLSTCRYIYQGFQLDEDTCVCHITFIAPLRITAVYMGPVFSVVTNNRHAIAFLVSHVTNKPGMMPFLLDHRGQWCTSRLHHLYWLLLRMLHVSG